MKNRFTVSTLNAILRDGPYAWPGGYPIYFICHDGEALSFKAAEENKELITESIESGSKDSWHVIAYAINWEDEELYCAHSNDLIECAYPSDKGESE